MPKQDSLSKLQDLFGEDAFDEERAPAQADDMNALASWLFTERESNGMPRNQPAVEAGIPYQTIYNR